MCVLSQFWEHFVDMSLSLKKQDARAYPIAIVSGGDHDKKYVYLSETSRRETMRGAAAAVTAPAASKRRDDTKRDASACESASESGSDSEDSRASGRHSVPEAPSAPGSDAGSGSDESEDLPPPTSTIYEAALRRMAREHAREQERRARRSVARKTEKRNDGESANIASAHAGVRDAADATAMPTTGITLRADEHMCPEPTHNAAARDLFYLSGQSGCGKSTMIKMIATRYRALWPKRHIVLISKLADDETLPTGVPPLYVQRLRLDTLVSNKLELPELQDALLLVDDVEGLPKDQALAVQELVDLVGNQGRHFNTSIVYASHMSTDYKRTRTLLMESQWYVFYPTATSASQLRHLLERYGGLDRKQVAAARRLPSRWVALRKVYPPLVVYDGGAYILNTDDD